MPEMTIDQIPVLNPAETEAWIREVKNRIAKGVSVVTDAERDMKARKRDFDNAWAYVMKRTEGPEYMRKIEATIETMPHRERFDNAEIAFNYAIRLARSLDRELFAAMAVNKSVLSMWEAAGVGS